MSYPGSGVRSAFRPIEGASRIALSPWSRDAANPVALAVLETRCEALGVRVSTVRRRDGSWMIRVRHEDHARDISLVGKGGLEVVIAGALDDYEAAHLYSGDELLAIQRQSEGAA